VATVRPAVGGPGYGPVVADPQVRDPAAALYVQAVALIRARSHDDARRLEQLFAAEDADDSRPLIEALITVAAAITGTAAVNLEVPTDQVIDYARDAVLELLHRADPDH